MTEDATQSGDALYSQLKALPKIDLHRHLEGSLRLETLSEIAREHKIDLPGYEIDTLRPLVQIVDGDPQDSNRFLKKFGVLRLFYRSAECIDRVTCEAIADAAADNVEYLELRFTPKALAATMDFPLEEVTGWVVAATERAAQKHGIQVSLIVSMNRHEPIELGERVAQIAVDYMDRGVVGLDLAGDEVSYPVKPFAPIFKQAKQAGLQITIHAGEWAGAESVRDAIELAGAERLGHGVRTIQDESVVRLARDRGVALEVCVTSNLQSGAVMDIAQHPLRELYQRSLLTTINTDDPSISDVTLTDEMVAVVENLGLSLEDIKTHVLNAAQTAFLPDGERAQLVAGFRQVLFGQDEGSAA